MTTVSLRVKPEFTPEDLLNGLFLNAPWNSSSSGLAGFSSSAIPAERKIRTRQNSLLAISQGGRSSSYTRVPHFFTDRDRVGHLASEPRYRLSVAATVDDDDRDSVKGLRPLSGRGFSPPDTEDMLPSPSSERDPLGGPLQSMTNAQLPHAVVISGLEVATSAVQETLWDVLRTRTVVLEEADGGHGNVWNLPDGFILVYVCPLGDGSSRPAIQNALVSTSSRILGHSLTVIDFTSLTVFRFMPISCYKLHQPRQAYNLQAHHYFDGRHSYRETTLNKSNTMFI